jgi:hypothetical protein
MKKAKQLRNLRVWNLVMFVLHGAQSVIMFALSSDFALPLTTLFVEFDLESMTLAQDLQEIATISIGPLVAGFLFLSSMAHLAVSLPGVYEWYTKNLKKGINHARWIEYSFSSSLMIVVIAMLTGMYDVITLGLMFSLNAMMILFGWVMEVHNQTTKKTNWISYVFGTIAGIIPWIAIALFLLYAGEGEFKAPTFVYWIFFSMFLFFNTFAINMILQYKKVGKWKSYLYGEKMYIILSLVAKTLLAWQVWAGTLRPL